MVYKIKPRPFICLGIIIVSVVSGIFFSGLIRKEIQKKAEKLEKCIIIKDSIRFTSLKNGEFMAEGRLRALHPQSWALPGLPGRYLEILAVQEEYRSHTRVVPRTDSEGHTRTSVETYHSWDEIKSHRLISDSLIFLGRKFGIGDVDFEYNTFHKSRTVVNDGKNLRTVFYTYPEETRPGILYGKAYNGRMSGLKFEEGKTIETLKAESKKNQKTAPAWFLGIWIFFGLLAAVLAYIDNRLWD